MYKHFIWCCLALLFSGCSSSLENFKIIQSEISPSNYEVGIYLLPDCIRILNKEDIADDIGEGKSVEIYTNFLKKEFPKKLNNFAPEYSFKFIKTIDTLCFDKNKFKLNDEVQMFLYIPCNSLLEDDTSVVPNYVVIIQKIFIARQSFDEKNGFLSFNFFDNNSSKNLYHKMNYYIWDNIKNRVLAFGKLESKTDLSIFGEMSKNTWIQSIEDLAEKVISESPFSKDKKE